MPFSRTTEAHSEDYWTRHFVTFLKPLIERDGQWQATRSTAVRGDIVREIITQLVTARAVVADLTDGNPNVFWELGVRQSFRHGTVTIAEHGMKLPFDLATKGTHFYDLTDRIRLAGFERQFRNAMRSCAAEPELPDSHVLETLGGRGTVYELIHREESLRRIAALIEETTNNAMTLKEMTDRAEANRERGAKRGRPSRLLRLSCCEFLMTSRYLDCDATFYRLVEDAYDGCVAINHQFGKWDDRRLETERWLLAVRQPTGTHLEKFQDALVQARAELERRR